MADTLDIPKIPASEKPVSDDFEYAYVETVNKAFVRIAKERLKEILNANRYTNEEIDQKISTIPKFNIKVVSSLPTTDISETTIYLVSSGDDSENLYTEYININGLWEILGTQKSTFSGSAKDVTYDDTETKLGATNVQDAVGKLSATKAGIMTAHASGTEIICTDGADAPLGDFKLYGKCEQNGEQTPQNPIEIVNVGTYNEEIGKYEVKIKTTGKNLIPYPYYETTKTINGITFTDNGDGSITVNGTAMANTFFTLRAWEEGLLNLPVGTYMLSGALNNSVLFIRSEENTGIVNTTSSILFDNDIEQDYGIFLRIASGKNINNETIYPMLEIGSLATEYEPYKEHTVTIELDEPLRAIPVVSNGNHTDKNGQQWICDTLERDSDGSYKITRRIERRTFDGSDSAHNCDYINSSVNNGTEILVQINLGSASEMGHVLFIRSDYFVCDKFIPFGYLSVSDAFAYGARMGSNGAICIMLPTSEGVTDIASANEWLSQNPVTVHYPIKTPIIETLPPSEIAKLSSLHTFKPTTIITADGEEMEIEYVVDIKRYISRLQATVNDLKGNQTTATGWTNSQIDLLDAIGDYISFNSVVGGQKWDALIESLRGNSSGGEEPETPPTEPDVPEVTLSSISATYTGGEVTVGTELTDLTGITLTAHYSDGSTSYVTDYTLSGEIAEGENTITVSYGGKVATFTVVGIAESTGDDVNNGWTNGVPYTFTWSENTRLKNDGTEESIDGWIVTDYLPCEGASLIEWSASSGYGSCNAFYDENKNFITSTTAQTLTIIPRNAKYARFTPSSKSKEITFTPHKLDVLNENTTWESGKKYNVPYNAGAGVNTTTGAITTGGSWWGSGFIFCYGANTIKLVGTNSTSASKNRHQIAFYDSEKNFISGIDKSSFEADSIPTNAVYCYISCADDNVGGNNPYVILE